MKKRIFILTIALFLITGCGVGVPEYDDAVLDGVSHLNRDKPEKALEDFNRAIMMDPQRVDGYAGRANVLNVMGRYAESIKDYNIAIEMDPTLANAYVNRGIAYSHMGEYEKAIADFEKGLELDPEINDAPGFFQRLFDDDTPNRKKGLRKYLASLKEKVKKSN